MNEDPDLVYTTIFVVINWGKNGEKKNKTELSSYRRLAK